MRLSRPIFGGIRVNRVFLPKQVRYLSKFDKHKNFTVPANKARFVPKSGTYPKGFSVGSINVGIKSTITSRPDLILVAS